MAATDDTTDKAMSEEKVQDDSAAVAKDNESKEAAAAASSKKWTDHYEAMKARLPEAVSSRLPSSDEASKTLDDVSKRMTAFGTSTSERLTALGASTSEQWGTVTKSTSEHWETVSKSTKDKVQTIRERGGLTPDKFFAHAYSISNATEIPLNISLNQVGPLMYEVVKPGESFERRVPNVWYRIEVRPFTVDSTAYDRWSVTWPILVLAGPTSAAISLIAIPFVALVAGGSALASLTSFGSTVATGVSTTAGAVASGSATVAKWTTRATMLPKVRTKLVDAASKNVSDKYGEAIKHKVVKYLTDKSENREGEAEDAGERADRERAERELAKKRSTKLTEVDITGHDDLQKVLRCETGDKKLDKELTKAFKKLEFTTSGYKAKRNPVLAVCGGPTIEERDSKTWLVFYPLFLQELAIEAEPMSLEEQPPTQEENALLHDATVVDDVKDAEKLVEAAPKHAEGDKASVDKAGEDAVSSASAAH